LSDLNGKIIVNNNSFYPKTKAENIQFDDNETLDLKLENNTLACFRKAISVDVIENTRTAYRLRIKTMDYEIITPNLLASDSSYRMIYTKNFTEEDWKLQEYTGNYQLYIGYQEHHLLNPYVFKVYKLINQEQYDMNNITVINKNGFTELYLISEEPFSGSVLINSK
jgi:hypothetical protein